MKKYEVHSIAHIHDIAGDKACAKMLQPENRKGVEFTLTEEMCESAGIFYKGAYFEICTIIYPRPDLEDKAREELKPLVDKMLTILDEIK